MENETKPVMNKTPEKAQIVHFVIYAIFFVIFAAIFAISISFTVSFVQALHVEPSSADSAAEGIAEGLALGLGAAILLIIDLGAVILATVGVLVEFIIGLVRFVKYQVRWMRIFYLVAFIVNAAMLAGCVAQYLIIFIR